LSDKELLERSRAADEEAFALLVGRHQDLLVNYLTKMLRCREQAEELAQETFVRFFRHLGRYRDQGTLAAYLLRIATNLVRSQERRRSRWNVLRPLFTHTERQRQTTSPQADLLADEAQQRVIEAIGSLDLRYRAPLIMREIEGLSYQQIALALGTGEGTVKSRLHRARALLKKALIPYWNGAR
jgi:RNA polymerase sigma-70 factor (ECF subfamily)